MLRGLETPTQVIEVICEPALTTIAITSNFTGVMDHYHTGERIELTIWARDIFENHRTASISETFELTVTG